MNTMIFAASWVFKSSMIYTDMHSIQAFDPGSISAADNPDISGGGWIRITLESVNCKHYCWSFAYWPRQRGKSSGNRLVTEESSWRLKIFGVVRNMLSPSIFKRYHSGNNWMLTRRVVFFSSCSQWLFEQRWLFVCSVLFFCGKWWNGSCGVHLLLFPSISHVKPGLPVLPRTHDLCSEWQTNLHVLRRVFPKETFLIPCISLFENYSSTYGTFNVFT